MKLEEIKTIKIGTMFNYPLYSSVEFIGTDERHVILRDRHGNEKKIYKSLFADYAKPVK